MNRACLLHLMVVSAVASAAIACGGGSSGSSATPTPTPTATASMSTDGLLNENRPDCPHDYTRIVAPKRLWQRGDRVAVPAVMSFPTGFTVSQVHTNVPEFNDCQAVVDRERHYGPLFAVFAAYHLDSLVLPKVLPASPPPIGAAAEVLDWSLDYWDRDLGIGPYFNCLYVYGTEDAPQAAMVHVGAQESSCGGRISMDSLSRSHPTSLAVIVTRVAAAVPSDYPAVARWDWDGTNHIQYIGIRCGKVWCEIGPKASGAAAAPAGFKASQAPITVGSSMSRRIRVQGIKGWYDDQDLSTIKGASPAHTNIHGWVFPAPNLGNYTKSDFETAWQVMSYVAIQPSGDATEADVLYNYRRKFAFAPVSPGSAFERMNSIWMRYAKLGEDGVPSVATETMKKSCKPADLAAASSTPLLLARMISAGGADTVFRCMTPRPGGPDPVVATARWRWITQDETVWQECLTGCCQVEANLF